MSKQLDEKRLDSNSEKNSLSKIIQFRERFSKVAAKIYGGIKSFASTLGEIMLEIYEHLEVTQKFEVILTKYNWPPIRKIDNEVKKKVVDLHESNIQNLENELRNLLLSQIDSEYINNLFLDWGKNNLLIDRLSILEEAINSHNDREYFSSVILIMSQIEGIIAKGFYHKGFMNGKKYKNYVDKLKFDNRFIEERAFNNFILETVLINFKHGEESKSSLSRHAIMHGGEVNFGTYENSVKMILTLDYLQSCFKYLYIEGQKTLHIYGCRYLDETTLKVHSIKNIWSIPFKDHKLCKICMKDFNNMS